MDEQITPDPNDQIVDPSVPEDEMAQFIKSLEDGYGENINLSTLLPQGSTDAPEGDEETPDDEEQETPSDDEPSDEFVTINGQQHPRADIQRLLEFDQFLRSNAEVAGRVAEAVKPRPTGESSVSQTPTPEADKVEEFTPPEAPEGIDLEDPRDKLLWDTHVSSLKNSWENRQELLKVQKTFAQEQQERFNRQAAIDMETALSRFRGDFKALNDDDIATIRQEAGVVLPGIIQQMGHNPEALYRAMEIAGYANADLRTRMNSEEPPHKTARQRSETRKRKLSSISGSPASAPKTESRPVYRNDRDMVQQFADALAQEGLSR